MKDPNLATLEIVVTHLEELANDFVFVGGAMVGLYIKDKAVPGVRVTLDIDCIVEVISRVEYYSIVEKLNTKGFRVDASTNITCRYKKGELILDVMPTDEKILGFTNQWYVDGVRNKVKTEIGNNLFISIFSVPYFIASKLEAFKGRGNNDLQGSHDIEDIVTVFDGDPEISTAIRTSPSGVREYLKNEIGHLLGDEDFKSCIEGHISDRLNISNRKNVILRRMEEIIN